MTTMTSLERTLATLGHTEPDRVPLFLLLTMHGAQELGLTIKEYFSQADYLIEGQLKLREKYGDDGLYTFTYASLETEAWGMDTIFYDDGPANAGEPFLTDFAQIDTLWVPEVEEQPSLQRVLDITRGLKDATGDKAPIIGVVMSPFSLPVMQMGFERYLNLIYEDRDRFWKLMRVNQAFCVAWANAQLAAGATAICYFDPVSSSTIVTPDQYRETGLKVAVETLGQINGPTATHFASGRCLPIADDVATTGTAVVGVSADEDLSQLKDACRGKMTLLGNLNGITMRKWSAAEAEAQVKQAIAAAGPGGGFILSDNHGEIPWQVPDEVLHAIVEAVHRWGQYPLDWTNRDS